MKIYILSYILIFNICLVLSNYEVCTEEKKEAELKAEQERISAIREYQKIMEAERKITGAPQVMIHSGDEFMRVIGKKRRM